MIAFFGTPEFAAVHLTGLLGAGFTIGLVVTRPDRPRGRGESSGPSPVKSLAASRGIPVVTPRRARDADFVAEMAARRDDLYLVVAYGGILPPELLAVPRFGSINLHASLLPRWRGAAPAPWAILSGDETTGVTTMFLDEGLDTGDMISARPTSIGQEENAGELLARLAPIGSELLAESAALALAGRAPRTAQDSALATHAPRLTKEEGWIRWEQPAAQLALFVRGMSPWPGARGLFRGEPVAIRRASAVPGDARPGSLLVDPKGTLLAGTGGGLLRLDEIQAPGRKPVGGDAFARGARIGADESFAAAGPA